MTQLSDDLLLLLFLDGSAVWGEDRMVFVESLHGESVIAQHVERVKQPAQCDRVSAAGCGYVVDQLVGDGPAGPLQSADSVNCFRCHLKRCLIVSLDEKLFDPYLLSFLSEGTQNADQAVGDAHGEIGRQSCP